MTAISTHNSAAITAGLALVELLTAIPLFAERAIMVGIGSFTNHPRQLRDFLMDTDTLPIR